MGASSVTGVGPGDSFGRYKPEHNKGCACDNRQPEKDEGKKRGTPPRAIVTRSQGVIRYRAGNGAIRTG